MASRRPAPAPAPRSGDLTMIVAGAAVFLLALGVLVALGLASLLFGRGWVWPPGVDGALLALGALFTGDPAGGLDAAAARRVPGGLLSGRSSESSSSPCSRSWLPWPGS